jgi:hypothetical protein
VCPLLTAACTHAPPCAPSCCTTAGEYIGLVDDDSGTHDNDGSATHHLPPSRTLTPPLLNDQTGSGSASACGVDDDRTLDGAMDGTMDGVLSLPSPSDAPAVAASRNDLSAADIA